MTTYQDLIQSIDPTINPVGVEAHMRCEYGTLSHLPREKFRAEIRLARECEKEMPGYLRMVADSYGDGARFDAWQAKSEQPVA